MSLEGFHAHLDRFAREIERHLRTISDFSPPSDALAQQQSDCIFILETALQNLPLLKGGDWRTVDFAEIEPEVQGLSHDDFLRFIEERRIIPLIPDGVMRVSFPGYESTFSVTLDAYIADIEKQAPTEDGMRPPGFTPAFDFLRRAAGYKPPTERNERPARRPERLRLIVT